MRISYLLTPLAGLALLAAAPRLALAQTTPTGAVGIGTTAPDASAVLDVSSTSKGLLPPRLSQAQRDAIASPATGLTVYNTTTTKLNTWNGTSWDEALSTTQQPYQGPTGTFPYTGAVQTYTVPAGVFSLRVDAAGAQGGAGGRSSARNAGGAGARIQATLAVTPGEVLTIYVGGAGSTTTSDPGGAGFNGGGNSGYASGSDQSGGGGGASDVRRSATVPSTALADRLLVAAGGGGGGYISALGGAGGAPNGDTGGASRSNFVAGTGATQSAGGSVNGALGQGGNASYASSTGTSNIAGGGGGGYYGGGGSASYGGGGGGSSYVQASGSSAVTMTGAYQAGNGYVTLTPVAQYSAPVLNGTNVTGVPGTWGVNGTSYYYNTGNVGIGTSTPAQKLDVAGNANVSGNSISGKVGIGTSAPVEKLEIKDGNLLLRATSAVSVGISNASGALNLGLAANSGEYSNLTQPGDAVLRSVGQRLLLAARDGGSVLVSTGPAGSEVERLRVAASGNVGIGTPTPGQKLEVAGQIYSSGSTGGFRFPDNTVQTTAAVTNVSAVLNQTTVQSGANFNIGGNGSIGGNALISGNVGIGTTTPSQPLDVSGNANVSGNSYVGGSVGIGTTSPAASAALDITSTSKGLLPPRLTKAQRDAIASPATGLTLYNTGTNTLNVWNGTSWGEALTSGTQPVQNAAATFGYTGAAQTYTVPAGVTSLRVEAAGAQGGGNGGRSPGGAGARVQATLPVTPGEVLTIYVGGAGSPAPYATGGNGPYPPGGAGYNGGGNGGYSSGNRGGGGGGASDVRRSATAPSTTLAERLLVAAGGGGAAGEESSTTLALGGAGGAPNGNTGGASRSDFVAGTGATQSAGGNLNGALGQGGDAPPTNTNGVFSSSGGGGGGYYGGGSGPNEGGGGGGSSYVQASGSAVTMSSNARSGNGYVTLTPDLAYAAPALSGANFVNVPGTWSVNGSSLYYNNGNVGIGTSTPAQKLDVAGNASVSGNAMVAGLLTAGTASVSGNTTVSGLLTAGTAVVNGSLGVGTASPTQALDVNGGILARTNGLIQNQGAHLQWNRSNGLGETWLLNQQGGGPGGIFFGASDAVSAGTNTVTEWARFDGQGNLGLGTPSPGQKLDVAGNATVSGNVGIGTANPLSRLSISQVTSQSNTPGQNLGELAFVGFGRFSASASIQALARDFDDTGHLVFKTSSGSSGATERLRITADGNVGIGTPSPGQPLTVQATSGGAMLGFRNSTSEKYNWSLTNGGLNLSESNVAAGRIFVQDGGNVGIGTTSPIAKLHVSGGALATPSGSGTSYFFATSNLKGPEVPGGSAARYTAAYFTGGQVWVNDYIVAGSLTTTSDRRIKHVLGLSDRTADLALLNKLRITDYTYIDQHANTPGIIKKVIAQEVEQVLPTAVSRSTQAIPNVYEKATKLSYAHGQLTVTTAKPHELPANGGRLRFYTPANDNLDVDVTVLDAHTVRFASTEAHAAGLFVYGKYVDDFRSVDYDALTTLNVSATQELARQVADLKAANAALKANADAVQAELQTVKTQATADKAQATATLETFEARLRRLEAGSGQAQR